MNGRAIMRRILCSILVAACLGHAHLSLAEIDISPGLTTSQIDSTHYQVEIFMSIVTSGEIVAAYDLDLSYDHNYWHPTGVTFGTYLGNPASFQALQGSDFSVDGVANIKAVSLITDETTLYNMQNPVRGHVALANVTFTITGTGANSLSFDWGLASRGLRDVKGMNNMAYTMVPEPSTYILSAVAGVIVASTVWYRQRRSRISRPS